VKHEFVTAGFGEWKLADYATAALATDGSCAVVYLPSPRQFQVNLSKLKGPVSARWFDPTSGRSSPASDGSHPNAGEASFIAPGKNAAGESDWVLVLESR
jgi:hypothetical protein